MYLGIQSWSIDDSDDDGVSSRSVSSSSVEIG